MPDVYTVPEGDSVTVTLVTNIPYSFGFVITVEGISGTATGRDTPRTRHCSAITSPSPPLTAGDDFDGGPKQVTFEASVTSPGSVNVTFLTLTDSVFERQEAFLIELTGDSNVGVGSDRGLVLIEDQTGERDT